MVVTLVTPSSEYVLNHCTRYLARDNTDARHAYFGLEADPRRAALSEAWRFPIIDAHSPATADESRSLAYADFNDVTFVYTEDRDGPEAKSVELVASMGSLASPIAMARVADSIFWSVTLKIRRGECHRYKFLVDGALILDPINPQIERRATGDVWSRFFTWAYSGLVTFERWEYP